MLGLLIPGSILSLYAMERQIGDPSWQEPSWRPVGLVGGNYGFLSSFQRNQTEVN